MHLIPLLAENSLFKSVGQIFHPLFEAIAYVLAYIYGIVPDYTASIVILTVLIMAVLTPLTIKSTKSMLAMQRLSPEMQKLRQKYKGAENRQLLNEEMMKLYREHGVSPTGGCLPMFLQMPALIVLYDVIEGLANTVKQGAKFGTGHRVCHQVLCATPRYIPHHSAMYHNLIAHPGVMHSIGLNLADKPLSHQANWWEYIPYFALIAVAVGLQYFQMQQMTKRNKKNNTTQAVPQQMQMMQKFMPLIFAYIYFLVPIGVAIYMIVSSAIRVLTQDLIFRFGVVEAGGQRQIGGGKGDGKTSAIPARSTVEPPKPRSGAGGNGARAARPPQPSLGSGQKAASPGDAAEGGGVAPTGKGTSGKGAPGKGSSGKAGGGAGTKAAGSGSTGGPSGPRRPAPSSKPAPSGKSTSSSKPAPSAKTATSSKPASSSQSGSPWLNLGRSLGLGGRSSNGKTKGSTNGSSGPKVHPRSKSKRPRKAR